jgi:tetratricopeptide (TPR) repeat protein
LILLPFVLSNPINSRTIEENPSPKSLWSPIAIGWISLLFTPIPAVIMAALNFGRSGQLQKQKLWLFYALVSALIYCLASFRMAITSDDLIGHRSTRALLLVVGITIAWALYHSQQYLFERHIQQGGKKSSVLVPVLGSLLGLGVTSGVSYCGTLLLETQINREFEKAVTLMSKGEYQSTKTIFRNIKGYFPYDTSLSYNLAIIYSETDRIELAKQELKQIIKLEPDSKDAQAFLNELQTP